MIKTTAVTVTVTRREKEVSYYGILGYSLRPLVASGTY